MAALQMFITPAELDRMVRELASAHDLDGCRYERGHYGVPSVANAAVDVDGDVVARLFLVPRDQRSFSPADPPRPRDMGWIDVTPGLVVQHKGRQILTMSTLQAEDREGLPFKPASWLRALKRKSRGSVAFGVKGINVVHGGSHEYPDIGYSEAALRLHRDGVVWKQYRDDNSEYAPLL